MRTEEIKIIDMGSSGEGIGKSAEGETVFIYGALLGDTAKTEITKDTGRFLKGRLVSITEKSALRNENPPCPDWERCGGCPLMGLKYEAQLKLKEKRVKDALTRIAGLKNPLIRPILKCEKIFFYRNKAVFAIEDGKLGYFAKKSHSLVEFSNCVLQSEKALETASKFRKRPVKGAKKLIVRTGYRGEFTAYLVMKNGKRVLYDGKSPIKSKIVTKLSSIDVEIYPETFYQVNREGCEKLYSKVQEYASLTGRETVLDLYCGAGSIGLSMAGAAGRVLGVEENKAAAASAERNAALNGIANAAFICEKAEKAMGGMLKGFKADIAVVDPPRRGCEKAVLEALAEILPKKLIYVSCDPATLARDIKILTDLGFTFVETTPVDMFPHTAAIETVSLLKWEKF